jgi:hypothetical protein
MNDTAGFLFVGPYGFHSGILDRGLDSGVVDAVEINILASRRIGLVAEWHQYKTKWIHGWSPVGRFRLFDAGKM